MARKRFKFIIVRLNIENKAIFHEKKAFQSMAYEQ